jgi:hypothetical protein
MLNIDISDKKGKGKVSTIVRTWLKTNVLATEKVMDKKKGRETNVVVVGEWINSDEV